MPAAGGGGPGEVGINSNTTLTYTFDTSSPSDANGYNLSTIDVFSGWGDNGRFQQNYTINYSTVPCAHDLPTADHGFRCPRRHTEWRVGRSGRNVGITDVQSLQFVLSEPSRMGGSDTTNWQHREPLQPQA